MLLQVYTLQAVTATVLIELGLTVIVKLVVFAHCPDVGVKVYVVVCVLFSDGDQLPVTALLDVVGKADSVAPEQIGLTGVKVGVTFG